MSSIYTFQMTHERVKKLKLRPFDFLLAFLSTMQIFQIFQLKTAQLAMLTAVLYWYGLKDSTSHSSQLCAPIQQILVFFGSPIIQSLSQTKQKYLCSVPYLYFSDDSWANQKAKQRKGLRNESGSYPHVYCVSVLCLSFPKNSSKCAWGIHGVGYVSLWGW